MSEAKMTHPKGLYMLFTVEMWERFGYYGMRGIFFLFMTKYLLFNTERASHIYGNYAALVYLTPMLGGYIADKFFGLRRSVTLGAILMALGYFMLAAIGNLVPAQGSDLWFFASLFVIILGNGFFKPNISTIVGNLYEPNDIRKDSAFTIFYMGINLGAMISPLICGTLGEKIGWSYGFAAAGAGMVLSLIIYLMFQKKFLGDIGLKPLPKVLDASGNVEKLTRKDWDKIIAIAIMAFFTIFFWAAFEQAGTSLTAFADRSTDRMLFNWEIPASLFQSLNPLFIILLAPVFSILWIKLAKKNFNPSTPVKFVLGLVLLALGFVVMIFAASAAKTGLVSPLWLIVAYLLHTMGELALSPVGLSLVTKLSPARFVSFFMGVWFLAVSAANWVAGMFAGNYDAMDHVEFFTIPVWVAGGSALLLLLLVKPIKKLMHGID